MAVLHDWKCLAHGVFEGYDGKCPHGCSQKMVTKIFLKAPAFNSPETKRMDGTLRMLANDFGLTDMNNQNGTSACVKEDWKAVKAREEMQKAYASGITQAVPLTGGENAIGGTMSSMGLKGDNAISEVRSMLKQPKPNVHASWDGKS